MAPRLRSGKGFTRDEILAHQKALRAGTANTTGFPALPTELLLEIVSHFPAIPLPMGRRDRASVYPASFLEKPRILRALSQMCRSLRSIFLPYVWQKIEVCANPRIPENISATSARRFHRPLVSKELATELITQLEIVTIRDPTLAQYIKIVNVYLTEFSASTVVAELVRCLVLFHNLHTVQLFSDSWRVDESFGTCFKGKLFPSVRTVGFNAPSFQTLASFPEARHVSCIGSSSRCTTTILGKCLEWCPKLEVLRGFEDVDYRDLPLIKKMTEGFPRTRTIALDADNVSLTPDVMKHLSDFPDLTCIELSTSEAWLSPRDKELIKQAEKILGSKLGVEGSPKQVIVKFRDDGQRIIVIP